MSLRRIARNILSNYALYFTTGVIGLILTPILFRSLHPASFAVLAFSLAIVSILESLDLGLYSTLMRFVGEMNARDAGKELRAVASTIFYLLLVMGLVAYAILLAGATWLKGDFPAVAGHAEARRTILIVACSLPFQLPALSLRAWLEGQQHHHVFNAIEIPVQLLRAALTIAFIRSGWGLLAVATVFPTSAAVRLTALLVACKASAENFVPRWSTAKWSNLQRVRGFASLSFVQDAVNRAYFDSDLLLGAKLLAPQPIALLAVAKRIPVMIARLSQLGIWVTAPVVAAASTREDEGALLRFVHACTRNMLVVLLPVSAVLLTWANVVLRAWIGPDAVAGSTAFRVYVLMTAMAALKEVPLTLLYGIGRIGYSTLIAVTGFSVALLAGAMSARSYGIAGIVVAYAAVQLAATILLFSYVLRLLRVPIRDFARKTLLPGVLCGSTGIVFVAISRIIMPDSMLGFALSASVSLTGSFAVFLLSTNPVSPQPWRRRVRDLLVGVS